MPILRILLVFLALATPSFAQDGARDAAVAQEAVRALKVYVDGVAKKGERPDFRQPEVAALLGRVLDLDALSALPPPHGSDISWLLDWMDAANTVNKLITRFGSKPGPQPDFAALKLNMIEYEDQFAATLNFQIRGQAREAVSIQRFMAALKPEDRTRVREEGFTGSRRSMAEFVLAAICSTVTSGGRPDNARLVAAAVRDTREVWASYFLPQDRSRLIEQVTAYSRQVPDETARNDLAAFTAALQAVE